MFGVVPKALWEKKAPADDRNRITLAMRPLLVRDGAHDDAHRRRARRQGERRSSTQHLRRRPRRARSTTRSPRPASRPTTSTSCSPRHLHFDHAGGFTRRDASGASGRGFRARATSCGAASGTTPRSRTSATARATSRTTSCRWRRPACSTWSTRIRRSCRAFACSAPAGTRMHHQIVWIESGGDRAVFLADLMPTSAHLPDPWIMGYDLYPMDTLFAKQAFAREAARARRWSSSNTILPFRQPFITEQQGKLRPATTHMTQPNDWHHRRQRPVRHGRTDRPRRAHHLHAVRRSVRPVRRSPRCAASASRFSPGTAPGTGCCRRS